MKYKSPKCPTCKQLASGTVDLIEGVAMMTFDEDTGTFDYDGETKVDWDSQHTVKVGKKERLQCPNGHRWASEPVHGDAR